jgi:23S rRNA (adenine2503-C2)-methyltransferase
MASLIDFARRYYLQRHKRMTFEYVLIKGLNDGPRDGELLGRRLAHIPVKVNVIPYNPTSLGYEIPEDQALDAFVRSFLAQSRKGGKRAVITVRRSAGGDIDGACGQLAATRPLQKGLTRQ